jgi:hypothetical protein
MGKAQNGGRMHAIGINYDTVRYPMGLVATVPIIVHLVLIVPLGKLAGAWNFGRTLEAPKFRTATLTILHYFLTQKKAPASRGFGDGFLLDLALRMKGLDKAGPDPSYRNPFVRSILEERTV